MARLMISAMRIATLLLHTRHSAPTKKVLRYLWRYGNSGRRFWKIIELVAVSTQRLGSSVAEMLPSGARELDVWRRDAGFGVRAWHHAAVMALAIQRVVVESMRVKGREGISGGGQVAMERAAIA